MKLCTCLKRAFNTADMCLFHVYKCQLLVYPTFVLSLNYSRAYVCVQRNKRALQVIYAGINNSSKINSLVSFN